MRVSFLVIRMDGWDRTFFALDVEAPRTRLERVLEPRLEDLPRERVLRACGARVAASPVHPKRRHARGTWAGPSRRGACARLAMRGG